MAKGISLHVGLNKANLAGIQVPKLQGCVNDAFRMQELVAAKFSTQRLLNEEATYDAVVGAIEQASKQLVAGDIFVFTFSGHGTRHGTDDPDEPDYKDENIVLFDKIMVDNVFRRTLWPQFKDGVRIFTVADCCHAEGSFTIPPGDDNENVADNSSVTVGSPTLTGSQELAKDNFWSREPIIRELDSESTEVHFNKLVEFYDEQRAKLPTAAPPINADLLMLSACEAPQKAKDGFPDGVFTTALLEVMKEGLPANYEKLHEAIALKLEGELQHPVLTLFEGSNPEFPKHLPFSI